jgi:hypothetical protein
MEGLHSGGGEYIHRRTMGPARDLLMQAIRELPKASKKEQFQRFQELLAEDEDAQEEVDWYYFGNILGYVSRKRESQQDREKRRAAMRKAVEKGVEQIQLLVLKMPNGKPMADCTGTEMASFSAAYAAIANKVGVRKVGDVLSENQVRALIGRKKAA